MGNKNINQGLYSLIKECFPKCFLICNIGSESGSLHSEREKSNTCCKEKQHLSLSSSTESLTPQKVEGQRETLLSFCTPSWSQGCAFGWKEALIMCLLHPLTCCSKQLSIDSVLPVLIAVKNLSNCKKKMVDVCLGHWPYLF